MDLGKPRSNASSPATVVAATILSYLEGVPVATINKSASTSHDFDVIRVLPTEFEEFCAVVSNDPDIWVSRFSDLGDRLFSVSWTNAPPIARMFRDHRYFRWFELHHILAMVDNPTALRIVNVAQFAPLFFTYGSVTKGDEVVLIGPLLWLLPGSSMSSVRPALETFLDRISRTWRPASVHHRREDSASLYPIDRLLNAANSRLVRSLEPSSRRMADVADMLGEINRLVLAHHGDIDIAQIAVLSSLVSAKNALGSYGLRAELGPQIEQAIERTLSMAAELGTPSWRDDFEASLRADGGDIASLVEHRQDTGALTWTQFFHESMAILDNWLATSTYFSIAPAAFAGDSPKLVDWNRLCRFLADVLLSSEVSIYRYALTEDHAPLHALGIHCSGNSHEKKAAIKRSFMRDAASQERLRRRSASYRAATQNATVYVADALLNDQATILVPDDDRLEFEWGRSVLAIPIRIGGNVWGVLELVSTMPRHFGTLLRPKCEEAAEVLSSTFLSVNVFDAVSRFDRYWSDDFGARQGRKSELCRVIADVFLADHVTVFTGARHPSEGSFDLEKFGTWTSKRVGTDELGAVSVVQVREFLDSNRKLQELPTSGDGSSRRTFMVELPARVGAGDWIGALIFSTPHPIAMDANWDRRTVALASLVSSILADLTSDASWEVEVRNVLRHEYRRVERQLRGIRTRLDQRIVKSLHEEDRRVGDLIVADLDIAVSSLEMSAQVLKATSGDRRLFRDPRLIAVKRAKEAFDKAKATPTRIRDAFRSQFTAAAQAAGGGALALAVSGVDFDVLMDGTTLSDILGTLADNAAKYSVPRSEVVMTAISTLSNGLTVTISNLGPALSSYEEEKVFEAGYRGEYARISMPDNGAGRGLGFAKSAMEIWGGTLGYRTSELSGERVLSPIAGYKIVWHRFVLTFPSSIVREHPKKDPGS
ncbi:ATP-binding protein [Mesorhizobium sp. CO1-1-8]|uniref:ATP-binding protein n=1 Tax=Mesorhizobium sp. CO1-1-8 TaxID=2876631 RepID=UPI001CD17880|nr:ATP-binding protein [Mesorhizobium sp. CO1-1-8]MBZ9772592.1 hypothetical protein [Mesorhizobium sp. CO1-1-8]